MTYVIVQVCQLFVPREFQEKYYFWYYDTYVDTAENDREQAQECERQLRTHLKEVNKEDKT